LVDQEISDLGYLQERHGDVKGNDLADWMSTMESLEHVAQAAGDHALSMWKQRRSLQWLVAAMASDADGSKAEVLLPVAEHLDAQSAAYFSAASYRARVKANSKMADEVLRMPGDQLSPSLRNRFLHEKLLTARNLNEFLSAVPRKAADVVWEREDDNYFEVAPVSKKSGDFLFDLDSTRAFNRQLPLKILVQAAQSETLPSEIRRELAVAAWTKAFLLRKDKASDEMAHLAAKLVPELKPFLDSYSKETEPESKQFAGVVAILHFPGLSPRVRAGIGRETPIDTIDSFRDNWWCGARMPEYPGDTSATSEQAGLAFQIYPQEPSIKLPDIALLSKNDKRNGDEEWSRLSGLETAPNLLAKAVLDHVKNAPGDARNPEALDLSLRALRYGCSDATYHDLSHRVFRVLHAKYPKSAAAKRNRPWG
jgi:hypothetical protein